MVKYRVSRLIVVAAASMFLLLVLPELCNAQYYERRYFLLKDGSTYRLNLSMTESLYEYYQQKNHQLTRDNFATFVTPYSMALVAEDIRSLFSNDEDFVNAVLMLVHQIPYEVVEEGRYPVETIGDNRGDCDLLSFAAASLLHAQDMDTVLLYYEHESHMNIGVSLPNPPEDARTRVTYVDYGGTRYYTAECTGDDWRNGWRVGECPPELEDATVGVVTLENHEQISPGQVSSSFGIMKSAAISLDVSSGFVLEGSTVIIKGQITALSASGTVTVYAATANGLWTVVGEATMDSERRYMLSWSPTVSGHYRLKASWPGTDEYAGADSGVIPVYVIPKYLAFAGAGLIMIIIITVVLSLMRRTSRMEKPQNFGDPPQSLAMWKRSSRPEPLCA